MYYIKPTIISTELKDIIDEISNDKILGFNVQYNKNSIIFSGTDTSVTVGMFNIVHNAAKNNVDDAVNMMCDGNKSHIMWKNKKTGQISNDFKVEEIGEYETYVTVTFENYTIETEE